MIGRVSVAIIVAMLCMASVASAVTVEDIELISAQLETATEEQRSFLEAKLETELDMSFTQDSTLLGYNPTLANSEIYYSSAAYCAVSKQTELANWKCKPCEKSAVSMITVFAQSTARGFIGYEAAKKRIVLAFSGTPGNSILTWAANINALPVNMNSICSGCTLHSGFYNGYLSVRSKFLAGLRTILAKYPNTPIFVTGHSLGGAQAVMAMADLAKMGYKLYHTHHTYGAPRPGNEKFAAFVNGLGTNLYRLVNNADIVPHVPPMLSKALSGSLPRWSYRQPNTEVFISKSGGFSTCKVLDGEHPDCPRNNIMTSVKDHLFYAGYDYGGSGCGHDASALKMLAQQLRLPKLWPGAKEIGRLNYGVVVGEDLKPGSTDVSTNKPPLFAGLKNTLANAKTAASNKIADLKAKATAKVTAVKTTVKTTVKNTVDKAKAKVSSATAAAKAKLSNAKKAVTTKLGNAKTATKTKLTNFKAGTKSKLAKAKAATKAKLSNAKAATKRVVNKAMCKLPKNKNTAECRALLAKK